MAEQGTQGRGFLLGVYPADEAGVHIGPGQVPDDAARIVLGIGQNADPRPGRYCPAGRGDKTAPRRGQLLRGAVRLSRQPVGINQLSHPGSSSGRYGRTVDPHWGLGEKAISSVRIRADVLTGYLPASPVSSLLSRGPVTVPRVTGPPLCGVLPGRTVMRRRWPAGSRSAASAPARRPADGGAASGGPHRARAR